MRVLLFLVSLTFCAASPLNAQVSISRSLSGWELANGQISVALSHSSQGVRLKSLHRTGGAEWAVVDTPIAEFPDQGANPYHFADDAITDSDKGSKQLTLRFQSNGGAVFSLILKLYPSGAVIQFVAKVENHGHSNLLLNPRIDPVLLTMKNSAGGLQPYTSAEGQPGTGILYGVERQHGFYPAGDLSSPQEYKDWIVLENPITGESALVGGEPGLGILGWKVNIRNSQSGTVVRAGSVLMNDNGSATPPIFELAPGKTIETPMSFLALARGDTDDAGNEAFRYLKRYIFLPALPNAPMVTYDIWLTEANSEEQILSELKLAKQVGFDAFNYDASWMEGASIVPGMNDWSAGLGSYRENKDKFPNGIKSLSDAVHAAGMKFGLWVDPPNVDAARVESGEIPKDYLVMVDGKTVGGVSPSLSPMKQICLGDPKVVAWLKVQLADIIQKWNLDWIKWDPSGAVTYQCTRTDHGHGRTDGEYAAYRGRLEILSYLLDRFPQLSGFEAQPSLSYSRINPGPRYLLPGGYTTEFITGPMVSPNVWGSFSTAGVADAVAANYSESWYSASTLDYYIRKHLTHGVVFGNINAMSSQLLSHAPPGFVEAFRRNVYFFKQYRHLLFEDVYHPKLQAAAWSSIQYVKPDASESVVYVFRDNSDVGETTVRLRGLHPEAQYRVTSLNDAPGRDRIISGDALMKGIAVSLPNEWLAKGDGGYSEKFADQLRYGSDILLLRQVQPQN